MLPTCSESHKTHSITAFGGTYHYDGPALACSSVLGSDFSSADEFTCYSKNNGNYAIVKNCEPSVLSPFTMPVSDGLQLSALILSVWVSAAIFRWLVAAVRNRGDE